MALMISPFTRFIRASRFRHFSGERLLRAIRSITHFITKIPTFLKHVLLALASDRSVFCILIHMYTYIRSMQYFFATTNFSQLLYFVLENSLRILCWRLFQFM